MMAQPEMPSTPQSRPFMPNDLRGRINSSAFAFRGYAITNLGRSAELLAHRDFGPVVERYLQEGSEICADVVRRKIDLADRVRRGEETSLETYDEALALIVAMSLAQLRLMEDFFDIRYAKASLAYGYSLGEISAIVASGVFAMHDALRPPIAMAADTAALAHDATMGVLFSRGPLLDMKKVTRLCLEINTLGEGVIGMSSILAPNTALLLGQGKSIDHFARLMHDAFPDRVYLRKRDERWPPMHTPIVWQRNIPNRAAVMMQTLPGGFKKPHPPVVSMVTGKRSYNDENARDLLTRWIDHPQRLWDAVYETLASGVETVVHVGPQPNLIPATFQRVQDNVKAQLAGNSFNSFGLRAMSRVVQRPWLAALLPSSTALLRAPMIQHIVLEDWLLAQKVS